MAANFGHNSTLHSIVPHNRCDGQSMSSHMSQSQELHYVEGLQSMFDVI